MQTATFFWPSSRANRAVHATKAAHALHWMPAIQTAFAFFSPTQIKVHATPNELAWKSKVADTAGEVADLKTAGSLAVSCSVTAQRRGKFAPASAKGLADQNPMNVNASRTSCLKILREFEPGKCRSATGRLVISGRMADVCAALDRMASQGNAVR